MFIKRRNAVTLFMLLALASRMGCASNLPFAKKASALPNRRPTVALVALQAAGPGPLPHNSNHELAKAGWDSYGATFVGALQLLSGWFLPLFFRNRNHGPGRRPPCSRTGRTESARPPESTCTVLAPQILCTLPARPVRIGLSKAATMAVSVEQLVSQLAHGGIVSVEDSNTIQRGLPADQKEDAETFIRELVVRKKLTEFQAETIRQGKLKSLVLGNYVILEKLGQGGMAQVFKAQHRRMKRLVALKELPPAVAKDPLAVKRFQREVEAAAKLAHPNIVTAFDADEANGIHFLVMEYVDGRDLASVVRNEGPLPVGTAIRYIEQAARGLEYAHKKGVYHRDVKPGNLLVDGEGTIKILDLGLARFRGGGGANSAPERALTQSGQILGTVDFMPPEQALNTKHADHRADVYSLGCSLYYLLSSKVLYPGKTIMEKLVAHREKPIPSLREMRQDVPEVFDAVFQKMVAKLPEDRYQSMSEVNSGIQACGSAARQAAATPRAAPRPKGGPAEKIGTPSDVRPMDRLTAETEVLPPTEVKAAI